MEKRGRQRSILADQLWKAEKNPLPLKQKGVFWKSGKTFLWRSLSI